MRGKILFAAALLLAGCTSVEEHRVGSMAARDPTPDDFSVCHGHGCLVRTQVVLEPAEWESVRALLATASSPAEEREQIALAVGQIESFVGPRARTEEDVGRNTVLLLGAGQLDCVDEAANTTTYLRMMANDGLLRFHKVGTPKGRGRFYDGWPHNTAVVEEKDSRTGYAIDSWFFENGEPAFVVPLLAWRQGWVPEDGDPPAGAAPGGDTASLPAESSGFHAEHRPAAPVHPAEAGAGGGPR